MIRGSYTFKFLTCILLSVFATVSCSKKENTNSVEFVNEPVGKPGITITDSRGRTVSLKHPAIQVVSLLPSVTEFIFELDQGHLLVGRTNWCKNPKEALEVEVVGTLDNPVIETLVKLKPDLILASAFLRHEQVTQLENLGLTVVVFDHQNWDAVVRDLEILGKVLGNEGDVKTLISWLDRKRQIVQDEVRTLDSPKKIRTAVLYALNPLHTASKGTFIDEFISLSGGENIAADLSSPWPTLSVEGLLQKQPEVILISTEAGAEGELAGQIQKLAEDQAWSQLSAFKNNRVYLLDGDTLAVPGPRQVVALAQIASALHPELFKAPVQLQHVNLLSAALLP